MGPYIFPAFDPIAISLGPFAVRWYALAYIAGLLFGWRYCLRLAQRPPRLVTGPPLDDFPAWATLGVVLRGGLGKSEGRRAGKECDSSGRSRGAPGSDKK